MRIEEEINKIVSDGWKIRMTGEGYISFERDFLGNTVICFLLDITNGSRYGFYFSEKSFGMRKSSGEELYDFFTKYDWRMK